MPKDQDDRSDAGAELEALRRADIVAGERSTAPPEGMIGNEPLGGLDVDIARTGGEDLKGETTEQTVREDERVEGDQG